MSAIACATVCPGNAYIRSRLKLSKFDCAISIAARACDGVVDAAEYLEMPGIETLNADRQPVDAERAEFGELARLECARIRLQRDFGIRRERQARTDGGQQVIESARPTAATACRRRRTLYTPAGPRLAAKPDPGRRSAHECSAVPVRFRGSEAQSHHGNAIPYFMRIEVAIGTLAHAPWDMNVEGQRWQDRQRDRRVRCG